MTEKVNRSPVLILGFIFLLSAAVGIWFFPDQGTRESGVSYELVQKLKLVDHRASLQKRLDELDLLARKQAGKGIDELHDLEVQRLEMIQRAKVGSDQKNVDAGVQKWVDIEIGNNKKINVARKELAGASANLEAAEAAISKAEHLFEDLGKAERALRGVSLEIGNINWAMSAIAKAYEDTVVPSEKAKLLQAHQERRNLKVPLEKKREVLHTKVESLAVPKRAYLDFYESEKKRWKEQSTAARKKLGKLTPNVDLYVQKIMDSSAKAVGMDPEKDYWVPQIAREVHSIRQEMELSRTVGISEVGDNGCLLCHHEIDRGFLDGGSIRLIAEHREVESKDHCTVCHGGNQASKSFNRAGHYTTDGDRAEAWRKDLAYQPPTFGEGMMVPKVALASKMPLNRESVGEEVERGEHLFTMHRCWACHSLPGYQSQLRKGPNLDGLLGRAYFSWLVRWLKDPESYTDHYWRPRYTFTEEEAQKIGAFLWVFPHVHEHGPDDGSSADDNTPICYGCGMKIPEGIELYYEDESFLACAPCAKRFDGEDSKGKKAMVVELAAAKKKHEEEKKKREEERKKAKENGGSGHDHGGDSHEGHSHDHGGGPVGDPGPSSSALKVGRSFFQRKGCVACHRLDLPVARTRPTIDEVIAVGGRRLLEPIYASPEDAKEGKALYPVDTRLNRKILKDLRDRGVEEVVVSKKKRKVRVKDLLVSQKARLQFGYPDEEDPLFPAGSIITDEVLTVFREDKKKFVEIEGMGSDFGPDLSRAGEKLTRPHLIEWIMNPQMHQKTAIMPNFRYDLGDASSLATYILSLKSPQKPPRYRRGVWVRSGRVRAGTMEIELWQSTPRPAMGVETRFSLRLFVEGRRLNPSEVSRAVGTIRPAEAGDSEEGTGGARVAVLPDERDRELDFLYVFSRPGAWKVSFELHRLWNEPAEPISFGFDVQAYPKSRSIEEEGRTLVEQFQCAACHYVPDSPSLQPSPIVNRIRKGIESGRDAYSILTEGIETHRIGRPDGPVNYNFSETDRRAIASFMIRQSLTGQNELNRSSSSQVLERGRLVLERQNCYGCHRIAGRGGGFGPDLTQASLRYRPSWLRSFLKKPHRIRKIDARLSDDYVPVMPTMNLTAEERETLERFFAEIARNPEWQARVQSMPAHQGSSPEIGKVLVEKYKCASCHWIGGAGPVDDTTYFPLHRLVEIRRTAPPLGFHTVDRLDPQWMAAWIHDPPHFVHDTPMPKEKLSLEEAAAIRDYILRIGREVIEEERSKIEHRNAIQKKQKGGDDDSKEN